MRKLFVLLLPNYLILTSAFKKESYTEGWLEIHIRAAGRFPQKTVSLQKMTIGTLSKSVSKPDIHSLSLSLSLALF